MLTGDHRTELGLEAENRAADFLLKLGYTIITRRYRVKGGEIDLIALDSDTLVFVEVKLRYAPGYSPEEAVGAIKFERMCKAAGEFRKRMGDEREVRYDLIAIDRQGLRHYKGCYGTEL